MSKYGGKTICIFSSKGGSGKSITALNLAGVFALLEKKVLIIDLDTTSGSIATYLNKPFQKSIYSFGIDYANNRFNNLDDYVTKYNEYISFIASPKDPRQGSKILPIYNEIIIEKAKSLYDIVIIDTTHVLNEFNISILDKCDITLLNLTNDLIDIKNMHNLISIFKDASKTNYKLLLNESISQNKKYYSLYDIKNIIDNNIDYYIDSSFYIKTIDNYIADGLILTLDKRFSKLHSNAYKVFNTICNDIMEMPNE